MSFQGLNRDLLRLNNVLRTRTGQENRFAAEGKAARIPAAALPEWLRTGARCCYVSKSTGGMHKVKVQKVDEKQQTVTVVFEQDQKNGKKVPFSECSKLGDGTLRPVFTDAQQAAPRATSGAGPAATTAALANSGGASRRAPQAGAAVEDIPSSDDGGMAERRRMFVPRAVALGNKKADSEMSSIGPQGRPENYADVSDDEVIAVEPVATAGSNRPKSRSPRRRAPST